MKHRGQRISGFTIVELLIVIVVIAILAAISVVAYNGIQTRSQSAKISSDLGTLRRAIMSARVASGEKIMRDITESYNTSGVCMALPNDTDLSVRNSTTDACWTRYIDTMTRISNAGGVDVKGLTDPWGRPYFIDENEKESGATCGSQDNLAVFPRPHISGGYGSLTNAMRVPYITPGC